MAIEQALHRGTVGQNKVKENNNKIYWFTLICSSYFLVPSECLPLIHDVQFAKI